MTRSAAVALFLVAGAAAAHPRPLPFSYTSELQPAGGAEVEAFVDLTPLRALSSSSGDRVWYLASQFQTEFEYGITDNLELGLYLTYAPEPGDAFTQTAVLTEGNGLKQRLRWSPASPGELPVDVNLYGEVVENQRAIELEAKVILQRRIGIVRLVANLTVAEEFYYTSARDFELEGSVGATAELSPSFHLGLEAWTHTEFPDPEPDVRPFGLGPHVYVGPTALAAFGKLWWSVGVYARVTDIGHGMAPGDPYGALWVRTIIGYDL